MIRVSWQSEGGAVSDLCSVPASLAFHDHRSSVYEFGNAHDTNNASSFGLSHQHSCSGRDLVQHA
jgi:hypothetical protein